ncbi:MAG: 3-isopropylmalate dehydratase small subunit [Planctomycetaceae bacterium]|nr:3-isopropylmalate dehydratase small subunit [Planctomycetaceae bacterium]
MEPFVSFTGLAAPFDRSDIDTDQLMPKQFLKLVQRTGFGKYLFFDWRYLDERYTPNPDFVLNKPEYKGAAILLSRQNFGCGSSREHAPWGLADFGLKVIIASSFADIFYNNAFKNGLLPIKLPEEQIEDLFQREVKRKPYQLTVNLEEQLITDSTGLSISFELDAFRKNCLLKGLDDIGITLQHEGKIVEYEKTHGII